MAVLPRLATLPVLAALTLSACGGGSSDDVPDGLNAEQQQVAQAVEDLQSAGKKRDADKICSDLLAGALAKQIASASKGTCEDGLSDALDDADAFDLEVKRVTVDGTTARAVVKSEAGDDDRTDTFTLQKSGGDWRVAALGGEGRPAQP